MATEPGPAYCKLKLVVGEVERCPGARCAFWEPGGAVLAGRCAFEQADLSGRTDFAVWLLDLRQQLESGTPGAEREARSALNRLLNEADE